MLEKRKEKDPNVRFDVKVFFRSYRYRGILFSSEF